MKEGPSIHTLIQYCSCKEFQLCSWLCVGAGDTVMNKAVCPSGDNCVVGGGVGRRQVNTQIVKLKEE